MLLHSPSQPATTTTTRASTSIAANPTSPQTEEAIKQFFTEVYETWVKTIMSPFYQVNMEIKSPVFRSRVAAAGKKYLWRNWDFATPGMGQALPNSGPNYWKECFPEGIWTTRLYQLWTNVLWTSTFSNWLWTTNRSFGHASISTFGTTKGLNAHDTGDSSIETAPFTTTTVVARISTKQCISEGEKADLETDIIP
jgi:hypothetical protein